MQLLRVIFLYEWKQLRRGPAQGMMLVCFILTGLFGISTGKNFLNKQLNTVDSLRQIQQTHLKFVYDRFNIDTTTATELDKTRRKQAGVPQIIEFNNPPYAIDPPSALSMLAIGQRDFLPYFELVNTKRDHYTPPEMEIANPEKLSIGNLDLSFILVYLLPGLIILWSYNLWSREIEQQTDRLLEIQGGEFKKIIDCKLLFRFVIVSFLALSLNAIGMICYPKRLTLPLGDGLLWQVITLLYIGFWFLICRLVVRFQWSSAKNMIILPGLWLLLTMLLPAFTEQCLELIYPSPSMADLASEQREIVNETWVMPRTALIDSFYKNNPQYLTFKKVSDTAEYGNKRFAAYHDLRIRRINASTVSFFVKVNLRNRILSISNWLNPVTQTQSLFIENAESGLKDHYRFVQEVDRFQMHWIAFLNSYEFRDKWLREDELTKLPQFKKKAYPEKKQSLIIGMLPILLMMLLLIWLTPRKKIQ